MGTTRTVTKTTKDGRTVVIDTIVDLGAVWARATLDGAVIATGIPGLIPPIPGHPEYTHGLGRVALTKAEFDAVMDLIRAARAEYDQTPEGSHARLVRERERLVNECNGLIEYAAENKATAFDRDELAWYLSNQAGKDEATVEQALAKLDGFDHEHLEIVAELRADEQRRRADNAIFD